ncbi:MAG: hypothetical protein AAGD09_07985 [Cyanobacteria bacterium P01_F01_bin.56]
MARIADQGWLQDDSAARGDQALTAKQNSQGSLGFLTALQSEEKFAESEIP